MTSCTGKWTSKEEALESEEPLMTGLGQLHFGRAVRGLGSCHCQFSNLLLALYWGSCPWVLYYHRVGTPMWTPYIMVMIGLVCFVKVVWV